MRIALLILSILATSTICISAQNINTENDTHFALRVKNFDEFIERFNNDDSMFISKTGYINTDSFTRKQFLSTLIHRPLLLSNSLADSLIGFINNNHIKLQTNSPNLYAVGSFNSIIDSTEFLQRLVLQLKGQGKGYKWVITNIDDDFVNHIPEYTIDKSRYIPPSNNDLNFIQVGELANQGYINEILDYSLLNNKPQKFIDLLKNGIIKINSCQNLKYFFTIEPHFIIEISKVDSKESNQTGWLITDILRFKPDYINKIILSN